VAAYDGALPPELTTAERVRIRVGATHCIEFVKTTHMFKQMRRFHFMFTGLERSAEGLLPLKVTTWAGEEDEADMILRGP
jgi:hypothetical protein